MTAAVKIVKTKKEMNSSVILGAVNHNKPLTIKTYYLTKSSQDSLKYIISLILKKFNKSDSMGICYNSVRGLVVNATKANIKRILFKDLGLDIANPKEYTIGMEKIEKQLSEKNFYKYKDELMKQNLTVKTTFNFSEEMLSITVKNNFILLPHEYQVNQKSEFVKKSSLPFSSLTTSIKENQSLGQITSNQSKVISLDQYKIDQQIFSQHSNEETNETIVKLDIVLKDKNTFRTEEFHDQMDTLYSEYKTKFDHAIEENEDYPDTKSYQTISKNFSNSLRGRSDFISLLNRIQSLDAQLYKEQQQLLANYGENVFNAIQEKISRARIESNEIIGQIQKVGKEEFELNKKQIEMFKESRDREIEKQTMSIITKHAKKLEDFNSTLDARIENQSIILKSQFNQHLDEMSKSSLSFIESTKKEVLKVKEDVKSELNSEINIAELMKHELFMQINSEKESLAKSLEFVSDEIRKIEQFKTNKEVMDSLVKQSEEAFWKMTSNIEEIKTKEENINTYMNNINLLETAILNTEKDLKSLEQEKTEFLNEKGKIVQTIDTRLKQMEKFEEEIKQKLVEIAGFEKKLNVISGSLTEQVKKTKTVDEQLTKFTKEVSTLESKKNELNHFVAEVDQKVALINSKTADIKILESRFDHIESMMIDLSARHKQISTMEDRLEKTKSNIEKLLQTTEEKISQMNHSVQTKSTKGRPKKVPPKFSGIVNDMKENVLALKKKRQTISEIAEALDINEEMVSAILAMQ